MSQWMPKLPRQFVRKVLAAGFLIALSAVASLLIKESIDSLDPESALPQITVSVGYNVQAVIRAGYEWNFLTTIRRSPTVSLEDLPLQVLQVGAQLPVVIHFTSDYIHLQVSRADGLNNPNFSIISGEVVTPSQPGIYVFCIEAGFKKGSIIYYFAVEVR